MRHEDKPTCGAVKRPRLSMGFSVLISGALPLFARVKFAGETYPARRLRGQNRLGGCTRFRPSVYGLLVRSVGQNNFSSLLSVELPLGARVLPDDDSGRRGSSPISQSVISLLFGGSGD